MEHQIDTNTKKTLGEKIKEARKSAGLTQEQLAEKLCVSRQAVTKWESNKGIPDIENIKLISKTLNISIDCLLDDGTELNMTIFRRAINLDDCNCKNGLSARLKKSEKKNQLVKEAFPDSKIYVLAAEQITTKSERLIDLVLGLFTDAPFGTPELINSAKNVDKSFYLVEQKEKQFFVTVTDDFIESKQLAQRITGKKFELGDFKFKNQGTLK